MTYERWLDEWLADYVEPSAKRRTYKRYCEIVSNHVKPQLGGEELSQLKTSTIQRHITCLLRDGNKRTGQGLSPNSVNTVITVINNSLRTAQELGYIEQTGRLKRPRAAERRVECFSAQEQKKIESAALDASMPKRFGIFLCLYTGLRIGELLALEWADVDFSGKELKVDKSCWDDIDAEGRYCRRTDIPKTVSSIRVVPLPRQMLPYLREQKRRVSGKYVVMGDEQFTVRGYQRTFERLLSVIKVRRLGFHSLRHTFATRALECGMDVRTLAEILGHKNPTITLTRYAHSMPEHKHEMMDRLGKLL